MDPSIHSGAVIPHRGSWRPPPHSHVGAHTIKRAVSVCPHFLASISRFRLLSQDRNFFNSKSMHRPQKCEVKILNHQLRFRGNRKFNSIVVGPQMVCPVSNQVLIGKTSESLSLYEFLLNSFSHHRGDKVAGAFFKSGFPCRPNPVFQKFPIRRKRKNRRKYIWGT